MALPSEPIQSPGMASTTQTLPADYGTGPSGAVLYTDGTATGTLESSLGTMVINSDGEDDDEPQAAEHEHEWVWKRNVTSRGYKMPAYEACECGATRKAEPRFARGFYRLARKATDQ